SALLGVPVIVPHYAGMAAPLRLNDATALFAWLIDQGIFTPLNNVESLYLRQQDGCQAITWNSLKGSWNLSLQTLGWGNALLGKNNQLTSGIQNNPILSHGYHIMSAHNYVFLPVAIKANP
ncbi:MAG: hypothetical protein KC419_03370, partial [Anaerolineales bacterium]|nr:hypothetical protein [Anaerolineales bacterium]